MGLTFDVQVERVREGRPLLVGGDAVVGAGGVATEVLREKKRKQVSNLFAPNRSVCVSFKSMAHLQDQALVVHDDARPHVLPQVLALKREKNKYIN